MKNITISRSTFIIPRNNAEEIVSYVKAKRGKIYSWLIDIPQKYFKN